MSVDTVYKEEGVIVIGSVILAVDAGEVESSIGKAKRLGFFV